MVPWHCLIITEAADRRSAWEAFLRSAGHRVVPAANEIEAQEALVTTDLDFIVLDARLSRLDRPALQEAVNPTLSGPPDSLEDAERRHIALTLRYTKGNRRQAARLLGIARSTMLSKLRKYGLEDVRARD
jgi:DNA-binding NtrC family response regulator